MKKILFLLITLLIGKALLGQAYVVTVVKGNVYHNNKPVKLHDRLDGAAQVTSDDKTAELALFSVLKGRLRLTFQNSKPVPARAGAKRSEFYQLIVAEYVAAYTTERILTTRGAFNLESFFNYADAKHPQNKIFLAEGQRIPLTGNIDKVFICTIKGNDTTCTPVTIIKDSLVVDRQIIKAIAGTGQHDPQPVTCLMRYGYTRAGKYSEKDAQQSVSITFLTTTYLKDLIKAYAEGLDSYYQGDKSKLVADVEGQLAYYYGNYYEPGVRRVLLRAISREAGR